MAGFVRVEIKDRIALVTIDRPPVNALNSGVLKELTQTFEGLALRKDVGVVILTGAAATIPPAIPARQTLDVWLAATEK